MTEIDKEEVSSQWARLASRKQPTKLVDFPANGPDGKPLCQVLIRTLRHEDNVAIGRLAIVECDRTFSEDKNVNRDSDIYQERMKNIAAKHFIFRACRDPENVDKPLFPTPDHVGKHLSNDEVAVLLKNYQTLQDDQGPIIAYMNTEQFDEYVSKLATDAEQSGYFLDRFLPEAQNQLLMYMASQLWNYQTGKFSPGTPAKKLSEDSKPE